MVITATFAAEKARKKRGFQLNTNSTVAKHYIFKPSLNIMGGLGKMIWHNKGQVTTAYSALRG